VPVGVVVSLLSAFETVSISIVVLSSEDGTSSALVEISFLLSVGNEKSKVSVSGLASLVVGQGLMLTESVFGSSHLSNRGLVGIDSLGHRTVSDVIGSVVLVAGSAHVLDDHVAI
jgi:hypothetical protein